MDIKILIVDDEKSNIELLEALLKPEGYTLIKASEGNEALRLLRETQPDMVLLDVLMPGITGYEVLKEIRKNESLKTIPVILLTSLTDREHKLRGIQYGADDFIIKPFDKTELVSRVKTQAGLSVLRRQINEKDKLLGVLELLFDGTVVTDNLFNIQHVNPAAKKMTGLTGDEFNLADFFLKKYSYTFDRNPESGEFIIEIPEKEENPVSCLSVRFSRAAQSPGNAGSFVFVFRDVSEERGRNKMKKDFLSLISGRLRGPMGIMSGYSRLIATHPPHEQLLELTGAIVSSSVIVEELINRILFFTEIENTSVDFPANELDVRLLAEKLELIYKKQYELKDGFEKGMVKKWQKISAEELLENAFKFCDKSKLVFRVALDAGGLAVEDNGPGIPEAEQELVFEPFYQIQKKDGMKTAGAGLGLAIVKRLADSVNLKAGMEQSKLGGLKVEIKAGVRADNLKTA